MNYQSNSRRSYFCGFMGLFAVALISIQSPAQTNCVPPPANLVAWWRAEGNALDFIGSGSGTLSGDTTYGAGLNGLAFEFDGSADLIALGNPASLQLQNFTIEAWIKRASASIASLGSGGVGVLFGYGNGGYSFYMDSGGSLYIGKLGDVAYSSSAVVSGTDFHHVALTKNGSSIFFYVDGVAHAGPSFDPGFVFTTSAAIGARGDNLDNSFLGRIDELSVYSRALTAGEIQAIQVAGGQGKCTAPSAPFIQTHPLSQTVLEGDNVFLSVLAGGTPPLTYQWRFEGTNIVGGNGSQFVLQSAKFTDAGTYSVAVSNSVGGVISSNAVLVVNPPPPCVTFPTGLVSWWRGEGNADDVISLNHGSMNGATIVPGRVGQGFGFDGVSSRVLVPASSSTDSSSFPGFTLECWIKPEDLTAAQPLAEWNNGSSIGAHFWISVPYFGGLGGPGCLYANLGTGPALVTAPGLLMTNSFQHVALTYDKASGLGVLYLNGNGVLTNNLGSFTPLTSYNLLLGQRQPGLPSPANFRGVMDEVSIYNRALTQPEIQSIYNAAVSGKCLVPTPPFILSQPAGLTVAAGTNVTFRVLAGGIPSVSFQWRFNAGPIAGATAGSLTLTNVGTNHAGTYSVLVTNQHGSLESSNANLTVLVFPPSLVVQPTNQIRLFGETVSFGVGANGTAPLSYQWNFNHTALTGETNSLLVLTNADTNRAGNYSVTVTNLFGSQTSSNALLTLVHVATNLFDDFEPTTDLTQWSAFGGTVQATNHGGFVSPTNSLWFGGSGSRFAATRTINATNLWALQFHLRFAGGFSPLWDRPELPGDGVVLEYSTNTGVTWFEFARYNTYALTNWTLLSAPVPERAKVPSARFRWRQLANSGGPTDHWALDDVSLITIVMPPEIKAHPAPQTVIAGSAVGFDVSITGSSPLFYQWRLNGVALSGMTNSSLVLGNVQPSQAGQYSVAITNVAGSVVSSNATLAVTVLAAFGNGQSLANPHQFSGPLTVELTNYFPGGLTFYTLDGSTPTFASTVYSGPFVILQNTTLRAMGYRADFLESGELGPIQMTRVPGFELTVISPGGGSVTLIPPGGSYPTNTVVNMTANPAPGWTFLKWLGDAGGSTISTEVTLTRDKTVQAVFGATLQTTAAGGGSVVMNPSGVVYPYGTVVLLSAIPTEGNQFGIWGNAASGNVNPLPLLVTNAHQTVSALFGPVANGQAALTVVPLGRGQVEVTPRANAYPVGAEITIAATPSAGQSFVGWSGDATGAANPLVLILDTNKLIFANFTKQPLLNLVTPAALINREGVTLLISGEAGERYTIETSTNLPSWSPVADLTNSFGTAIYKADLETNVSPRFYRGRTLP